MSDPVKRTLRTFIQAFLGSITTSGILSSLATDGFVDFSILQKGLLAAAGAAVIATFTFLQNVLEDNETIPEVVEK